jgi:hypothetical protein
MVRLGVAGRRRGSHIGLVVCRIDRHHLQDETCPLVGRVAAHGVLADAHGMCRVDHDPGLAGREQAIAVGANEPTALLARRRGEPEVYLRQVDNDAIGIGQLGDVVGHAGGQLQGKAG